MQRLTSSSRTSMDLQQVVAVVHGLCLLVDPRPGRFDFNLTAVEELKELSSHGAKHNVCYTSGHGHFLVAEVELGESFREHARLLENPTMVRMQKCITGLE